jgi:diguanylate cyclase (GGDEF)-like protein/PAS domain S-box-containing protein
MVPIARSTVMENISEMVLVVDAQNRVLDVNFAARRWLKKTSKEIVGSRITDVFEAWPELKSHYESTRGERQEIQIYDEQPAIFELIVSPLYNLLGVLEGRVIVAHDITMHKYMETELQKTNEALKEKLAEVELLQVELREQAIHDALTGVYNRRFLSQVLDGEVARAERSHSPISVAMMDVDYFKQFNDQYGHKCGDQVLQYLAKLLTSATRRSDIVCRYGGEEFVVLMPDATLEVARQRAEGWRQQFASNPFEYNGVQLHVSFSVGLASFPLHGLSGEAILQIADQALYESKANGRYMVTVYHPDH